MRALIKTALRASMLPLFRMLTPVVHDCKHMWAYLVLSSRLKHPVDASVVVEGNPEVRGSGDVRLGRNLLIYPGLYLETQDGASIEIGDDVVMSRGVHVVAHAGIRIGTGTMIGEYASIRDANHARDYNGSMVNGAHRGSPITIGSQVWICRGVTILAGVTIGDNVTIGANAVVTRDVPAGATVVGVPAAPIRSSREGGVGSAEKAFASGRMVGSFESMAGRNR